MGRWIRFTGTNSWAELHRGGDDGRGGVRFDLSPCPTISAMPGSLGGSQHWRIEDDGLPEVTETFKSRRNGKPHSFDDPAPTVQKFGIADERPTSLIFEDDGQAPAPASDGKPAYRVPLLSEIHEIPRNGLTVMSTFSGCGGSCLGFEWAGYTPLLAVEFVDSAVETYKANHPGVPVYAGDIRELTAAEALKTMGIRKGELDVLEGSPPCESFSTAGIIAKGWGKDRSYSDGKVQVMDDLFFEFTRLLGGIKPRAFVAENVSGLVKGASKGYFIKIHAELVAQGYRVEARMLDAQWLGVPQRRQRVIFVGVRNDLKADPMFPDPLPYRYSIRDALVGLGTGEIVGVVDRQFERTDVDPDGPCNTIVRKGGTMHTIKGGAGGQFDIERIVYDNGGTGGAAQSGRDEEDLDAPVRSITNAGGAAAGHFQVQRGEVEGVTLGAHGYFDGERIDGGEPAPTIGATGLGSYGYEVERGEARDDVADGQPLSNDYPDRWEQLGPGEADPEHHDLVRSDPDAPVATITRVGGASNRSSATHPDDPRKFSIPELRRLCGFPDDFDLRGTYAQQWERLGNSVPPPMMMHVAAVVRDLLLDRPVRPRRARARDAV